MTSIVKECVLNMSDSNDLDEAITEWYVFSYHESNNDKYRCHCGRPINNVYILKNKITHAHIQLGSICQNVFKEQVKYYHNNFIQSILPIYEEINY